MRIKIMAESADHAQKMTPEWSHMMEAEAVGDKDVRLTIAPDDQARKDLIRRLGLRDLNKLQVKITLKRRDKRVIEVIGALTADVIQECVTTLEPVPDHIEETFHAWFADPQQAASFARARHERDKMKADQEFPMLEEEEDPEPIIDGRIDLGELATQYLSLSLNPFPRSADALKKLEEQNDRQPKRENPFAALKELKDKK